MKLGLALSLALSAAPAIAATAATPDFGPNVLIFSHTTPSADIQSAIDKVYATQRRNEFGPERNAILFLPGDYNVDVPIGFYTQILGLGASPDGVHITGNVHSDAASRNNNATTTFWRATENFSVAPTGGVMQWAVSQAAPFRRMHIQGDIILHQNGGWASGGWMSDSAHRRQRRRRPPAAMDLPQLRVAQLDRRKLEHGLRRHPQPPDGEWPEPPYTKIAKTPIVREKPFLQVDASGNYSVRVPSIRTNSSGITWHAGIHTRKDHPHRAVLHRPPQPRQRGDHQHATRQGQRPHPHSRHLRAHRTHPRHATPTPSSWASASQRSVPSTAPPP